MNLVNRLPYAGTGTQQELPTPAGTYEGGGAGFESSPPSPLPFGVATGGDAGNGSRLDLGVASPVAASPIDALIEEQRGSVDELYNERVVSSPAAEVRSLARMRARRAGEFDDPCDHGLDLARCTHPDCVSLAAAIEKAYR